MENVNSIGLIALMLTVACAVWAAWADWPPVIWAWNGVVAVMMTVHNAIMWASLWIARKTRTLIRCLLIGKGARL